jgi:toxin-antitoxin system PIN domain toxin
LTQPYILADVNLWLATLLEQHPHHEVSKRWWLEDVLPNRGRVAFCRVTQLGVLRLLTNQKVMGPLRKTLLDAWRVYEQLMAQEPIFYANEPDGIDRVLESYCRLGGSSTKFWTDGYLAAFSSAGGFTMVTLDDDFRRFPGLDVVVLS